MDLLHYRFFPHYGSVLLTKAERLLKTLYGIAIKYRVSLLQYVMHIGPFIPKCTAKHSIYCNSYILNLSAIENIQKILLDGALATMRALPFNKHAIRLYCPYTA